VSVNYGWWLQYALWSLDDAVLLLYGIAPKSKRAAFLKKSLSSGTEPRGKRDREVYATYHKAQRAIDARVLPYQFDNKGVEPHVFLRWAEDNDFPMPEGLSAYRVRWNKETGKSPAWEGFDPDSETYPREIALQAWRAVTNRRNPSQTAKEQIRKWLDEHYPDLSKEAMERIAIICNWEKAGGMRKKGGQLKPKSGASFG
jgi:hypothetical protein